MDQPLGTRLAAEAVGTFLFFFLGFSGIAVATDFGLEAIGPLGIAFGFGLGLALAITAFGHISGGHFNPAVSAGLAIAGKFPSRDVIPYWIAQLVGGFGAVLVMAIVYSKAVTNSLGHAIPACGIDDWAALVLEIIATGLFVMVILTVATDERAAWKGVMAPLADRPLHLHRGDDGRPRLGWLVQPGTLARPRPLQPGLGRTSGSTSSARSPAACSAARSGRTSSPVASLRSPRPVHRTDSRGRRTAPSLHRQNSRGGGI